MHQHYNTIGQKVLLQVLKVRTASQRELTTLKITAVKAKLYFLSLNNR